MQKKIEQWRSPSLGKNMELAIYGDSGTPIIGLPTRGADCHQWNEFGMVDAISLQLEKGYNQLYCVSTVDDESFLNSEASSEKRLIRHHQFEAYLTDEVVPFILDRNKSQYIIIAGIDLGGYHAVNTALKHPELFGKAIGISGVYNIKQFIDGYYDEDVYYNNPIDYLPNLNVQSLLTKIRKVDFRLASFESDIRKKFALKMSEVFHTKFIEHKLDVWNTDSDQEWKNWSKMLKTHII